MEPDYTYLGARLAERAGSLQPPDVDVQYDYAFGNLCEAMMRMYKDVALLCDPEDNYSPWVPLFDVDICPEFALPWLAQVVGVQLPKTVTGDAAREYIKALSFEEIGKPETIIKVIQSQLIGSKAVTLVERKAGDAYALDIIIPDSDVPPSDLGNPTNLVVNPSGELGTRTAQSNSASNSSPVNLVTNPSGETTPTMTSFSASSTAPVNMLPNPSGEAGTVSASSVSASSTTPVNLVLNPSAEVDTVDWSVQNGTLSRAAGIGVEAGGSSFKLAAITAGNANAFHGKSPVVAGTTYTASAYCRAPGTGRKARVDIYWFDSGNAEITASRIAGTNVDLGTDTFTRISTSGAAPVGAVTAYARIIFAATTGDDVYIDRVMLTATTAATPYFDGSILGWKWNGTAHNSTSQPVTATGVDYTGWAKVGTHSTRYTATRDNGSTILARCPTGTAGVPVIPNNWYAIRCTSRVDPLSTPGLLNQRIGIYWYAAGGGAASTASAVGPTMAVPPYGTPLDLYAIFQAPADAAFAAPAALYNPNGTTNSPATVIADSDAYMMVDLGATAPPSSGATTNPADVPPYFDGNMFGWKWNGTANASTSQPVTATSVDTTAWAKVGTHASRYTTTRGTTSAATARNANNASPVVPGNWYAARVTVRIDPLTSKPMNYIQGRIYWFTAAQAAASVASTSGPQFFAPVPGTPYDMYVIGQAPVDAAFGSTSGVLVPTGATANDPITMVCDLDAFALYDLGATTPPSNGTTTAEADVPPYFDGATNGFVWNGTAHASTSKPATATLSDTTQWAQSGTHSSRYTVTRTDGGATFVRTAIGTSGIVALPNHFYAIRVSAKLTGYDGAAAPKSWKPVVYWYKSDGAASVVDVSTLGPTENTPAVGTVSDLYMITQAPSDAAFASIGVYVVNEVGHTVMTLDTDAYMFVDLGTVFGGPVDDLTNESDVFDYFDGDTAGYVWSGTAHNSTSKAVTTNIINDVIKTVVPAGIIVNYRRVIGWIYTTMTTEDGAYSTLPPKFTSYQNMSDNTRA